MKLFKGQPGKNEDAPAAISNLAAPGTLCLKFQPMTRDEIRREMSTYFARPVKGLPTILINGIPIPKDQYIRELNEHLDRWIDIYTKRGGGFSKDGKELPALDLLPDGRLKRHLEPTMVHIAFHRPVDPFAEWLPLTAVVDKDLRNIVHVPQADVAPVSAARDEEWRKYKFVRHEELEAARTNAAQESR